MIFARYLAREIYLAVAFVLLVLLALFFFIDFLSEVKSVGQGQYRTLHAALYVLLEAPANAYQLMPIAALIGAIYALAQFAANSEFTIMRVSGLSTRVAAWNMVKAAGVLAVLTFVMGEYIMPPVQTYAEKMKYSRLGGNAPLVMRSGFWIKDIPLDAQGQPSGRRFVNAAKVLPDGSLQDVRVYELDRESRLTALARAESATYNDQSGWQLKNVTETRFISRQSQAGMLAGFELLDKTAVIREQTRQWPARIDTNTLTAAHNTCTRIERSFRHNGWGSVQIKCLTSTIAHVSDGNCAWFARIAELTEIGERPSTDDHMEVSEAYDEWCASHKALRLSEIPRSAQRMAATWGARPLVETF
jgi:LPS export ABC transporter permease LptG